MAGSRVRAWEAQRPRIAARAPFIEVGIGPLGTGARGVLEVRCHEAPFALEHGQVVGRLVYERMSAPPERLYGSVIASNYQGQGLKLAKQFRQG